MRCQTVFLLIPILAFLAVQSQSQPVKAQLIPEVLSVQPGKSFWIALRLQMEEGWHTYWKNPGDAGVPTSIQWRLPVGFAAGVLQWPYPETFLIGLDVSYGYEGEVWLLTEITPPATIKAGSSVSITAAVKWLACLEERLPGRADLMVKLPVREEDPEVDSIWSARFKNVREKIPESSTGWKIRASAENDRIRLFLVPPGEDRTEIKDVHFFPEQEYLIDAVELQILKKTDEGFSLEIQKSELLKTWPARIQGVLFSSEGWGEPHGKKALRIDVKLDQ